MKPFSLETREVAAIAGVKIGAVYAAHSRDGKFRGIRPRKQPSGRLLWPRDEVECEFDLLPRMALPAGGYALVALVAGIGIPRVREVYVLAQALTDQDNDEFEGELLTPDRARMLLDMVIAFCAQMERVHHILDDERRVKIDKAATIMGQCLSSMRRKLAGEDMD